MSGKNNGISVKDYAALHHVSDKSVYAKIRRREKALNGHISKKGNMTFLDDYAQELLKPCEGNSKLAEKADKLQKELDEMKAAAEKYKAEAAKYKADAESYKTAASSLESDRREVIERLQTTENELADKKAEIKKLLEIKECLEKANVIFNALTEPKNAGIIRKLGIFGSKPIDGKNV